MTEKPENERRVLTTHVEVTEHGADYFEVDGDGDITAERDSWFAGVVVVDPNGRLAHLRHLDTTGHYDEGDDADEG
ncbi:hypothetical protein EV652_110343 [Kribbella steppae]|uniref:Uncharacterized protein n=1 Tax=Kribbella steppae TaxID=2512223 RepID=A0A4R2HB50_9ACTN|nr:hypothetical protein [Kribbella steppae]TCO22357.1 hypothetical protein EV652_110343 [Kribbella steppae]